MLSNLSQREKNILIFGIVFIILFTGYALGIAPVFEKRTNLTRIFEEKQVALEEIQALEKQYASVSNRLNRFSKEIPVRRKGFSLFAFLDLQARLSGVKEKVAYMKPFEKNLENSDHVLASVKVKLTQVYLKELSDFLYRVESAGNGVDISSLLMTRVGRQSKRLDVVIETQTLMSKKDQESKLSSLSGLNKGQSN